MKKELLDMLYWDKVNLELHINEVEEINDFPSESDAQHHREKLSVFNKQLEKLNKYILKVIEL